jgi:hypothetical protein
MNCKILNCIFSPNKASLRALIILFVTISLLLWKSCAILDDDPKANTDLHFPAKFSFESLFQRSTNVYYYDDYKFTLLDHANAGTFAAFLDTIPAYSIIKNLKLPFSIMEFLDTNQVHLTSDGTLGIPKIDTIVTYTKIDKAKTSIITINWDTSSLPPLRCTLFNSNGQGIVFTTAIYAFTYRPFTPPFVHYHNDKLSFAFLDGPFVGFLHGHMREGGYGNDKYFGFQDTLAVHWVDIIFE